MVEINKVTKTYLEDIANAIRQKLGVTEIVAGIEVKTNDTPSTIINISFNDVIGFTSQSTDSDFLEYDVLSGTVTTDIGDADITITPPPTLLPHLV